MHAEQNLKVMGMTHHSSIAMRAYTDLVRLLKGDALSGVEGQPTLKCREAYWYAARRVGTDMRLKYIGEDSNETRARINHIEELRATAFLIEAMAEDRSDELSRAYTIAMAVGPRWRKHINKSLDRMPETKTILENPGGG